MTNRVNFGEVITAMVTPFQTDSNLSVNRQEVEKLANYLLKNGTDTLLLVGSTGESLQLSDEERWDIVRQVRSLTQGKSKIIVSVGDASTNGAVRKTKKAFELGADGVLVSAPEYSKPPKQAQLIYFNAVATAAAGKPVILYNIPSRTGVEILPETVAQLAHKNPNIVGIKQSMGDLDKVSEMKMLCPVDFQFYSGDDSLTLPMLAIGAKGVISVASHLEGLLIKKMIRSFKTGKVQKASQIHHLLFPLYKALFVETNPLPVKEALWNRGIISSPTLRTLGEMTEEDIGQLDRAMIAFDRQKQSFLKKNKLRLENASNSRE